MASILAQSNETFLRPSQLSRKTGLLAMGRCSVPQKVITIGVVFMVTNIKVIVFVNKSNELQSRLSLMWGFLPDTFTMFINKGCEHDRQFSKIHCKLSLWY